ncbi:hypothetical protein DdX_13313 [Ditylenchus destructor]|uniref:Uncharacterized protein n=1 Tax=Ditylenchus destructor TaxID=166010 RepID=A0AAD4QZL0_9BILA|nr:hypothetical protein DdX_13313 [Ditylenchus destructor]
MFRVKGQNPLGEFLGDLANGLSLDAVHIPFHQSTNILTFKPKENPENRHILKTKKHFVGGKDKQAKKEQRFARSPAATFIPLLFRSANSEAVPALHGPHRKSWLAEANAPFRRDLWKSSRQRAGANGRHKIELMSIAPAIGIQCCFVPPAKQTHPRFAFQALGNPAHTSPETPPQHVQIC